MKLVSIKIFALIRKFKASQALRRLSEEIPISREVRTYWRELRMI
jgi:hypothetical protein